MGICDALESWDDIGCSSEGFEEVRDFTNETLEAWGFDAPNWSDQPLEGFEDSPGVYNSETGTIHLSPDFLCESPGSDAANVALHEGLHAAIDQAGWELGDVAEEWEVASLGLGVWEDLYEGCQEPTESGSPSSMPEYPWQSTEP